MKINAAVRSRLKKKLIKELKGSHERNVVVKTAVALEDADLNRLQEAVPELQHTQMTNEVDESIIAGMVIIDGSKIIDISVKGSLSDLVGKLL